MAAPRLSRRIDRLSGSLVREILAHAQDPRVISFAGGLPAAASFPPADFAELPAALSQYGTSEGEPALREEIAALVSASGRACRPEQVLVTSGSQQGIDLVAKLFIDDDSPVALESPTYLAALQAFRLFGARFLPLAARPGGIDAAELEAVAPERPALAYLIPNFQNPTGYRYARRAREEVAAVLDRHAIPLVEDEPYRELDYEGGERTPICGLLERAPWVYLGSFSKTALPGLRVGYLVSSPELFPHLLRLKQAADLHTNRIGQWWLARHLSAGEHPAHLQRLRQHYRAQRDHMAAALARHFSGLAQWEVPQGGLFFWLRLNRRLDTRRLLPRALARGVIFMPGEPFYPQPVEAAGTLRLNFSHAEPERIEQGLAVLAELVAKAMQEQEALA